MTDTPDRPPLQGIVPITCAVALTLMLGWLVVVGRSFLIPILIGVIAVYVLTSAANALGRVPGLSRLSEGWRRFVAGAGILMLFLIIIGYVAANAQAITEAVPGYGANFDALLEQVSAALGLQKTPQVSDLMTRLQEQVNWGQLAGDLVGALTGVGGLLFAALLYAAFLLAEWNDLPTKTRLALGDAEKTRKTLDTVAQINGKIGTYLASKTLVNIILGVLSLAVMWILGIEFALFWAILIGLMNYIPYVGSVVGVFFPATLALVQFASLSQGVVALAALVGAQLLVGNVLEPRLMGRSVNMSPVVILAALAFWGSVWGLVGAILAVPLTSMIMIILAEIPATRPVAVMMSGDGQV